MLQDESSSSSSSSSGSSQGSNEEGSEEEDIPFTIKDISLSAILSSLGLENRWTAPEAFLKAIFIAVIHRQLSLAQGTAACDLYAYDLIQAAWEVFQVQEDEDDFIDSVRRIVRDVSEGKSAAQSGKSAQTQGKSASAQSGKSAQSAPSSQSSSTSSNASPKSATAMAEELIASRRQDALKAVQAAKGQLLIHSVEMLVKQGLLAQSNAQSLLDRYAAGDAMVDAAIETYASDRDVVEFLDTLQILGKPPVPCCACVLAVVGEGWLLVPHSTVACCVDANSSTCPTIFRAPLHGFRCGCWGFEVLHLL